VPRSGGPGPRDLYAHGRASGWSVELSGRARIRVTLTEKKQPAPHPGWGGAARLAAGRGWGVRGGGFGGLVPFRGARKGFVSLRQQMESAATAGAWMILMLHGVGRGTHDAYIEADQHALLLDYLAGNSARIWTAPLRDVAAHLQVARP